MRKQFLAFVYIARIILYSQHVSLINSKSLLQYQEQKSVMGCFFFKNNNLYTLCMLFTLEKQVKYCPIMEQLISDSAVSASLDLADTTKTSNAAWSTASH